MNQELIRIEFHPKIFRGNKNFNVSRIFKDYYPRQFIIITKEKDKAYLNVSKTKYDFSEKKLGKFNLSYGEISIFWVLAELVAFEVFDRLVGIKAVLKPDQYPRFINELNNLIKLGNNASTEKSRIKSFNIGITLQGNKGQNDLEKKIDISWNKLIHDLFYPFIDLINSKTEEYSQIRDSYQKTYERVRELHKTIRKLIVHPLYSFISSNFNVRYNSHIKIIIGYLLYINNLYKFKPSPQNPEEKEILIEDVFSCYEEIDNQPFKTKPRLYPHEIRFRDMVDMLLREHKE